MNFDIYTTKSKEAIQSAQQLMTQNHNPQLEQIHLLVALLQQENGLVPHLLKKMDVTVESLQAAAEAELQKLPSISGSVDFDRVNADSSLVSALNAAENQAKTMKDEYVSVEHLLLGLLEMPKAALPGSSLTTASPRKRCSRPSRPSGATSESPPTAPRAPMMPWRNMAQTW